MSNLTKILFFAALTLLSACSSEPTDFPIIPSTFKVNRIASHPKDSSLQLFLMWPEPVGDLNCRSTWIVDSVGAFQVDEIVSFKSTK